MWGGWRLNPDPSSTTTKPNMSTLIPHTDSIVVRGISAWSRIKTTAAEQRQLWREVGEALLVGRAQNPSNQAFGLWCEDKGFDMDARVRSDAMWLAQNWESCSIEWKTGDTHPSNIRTEFKKADIPAPAPDLDLSAAFSVPEAFAHIEKVLPVAKTVNKLSAMAERGEGQEKVTAQKYLAKKAKDIGMEPEALSCLAKKLDPAAGVPASGEPVLEENLKTLAGIVGELVAFVKSTNEGLSGDTPISREFAVGLVLAAFNRLEN